MGCFDIFCPFCGLPVNTSLYYLDDPKALTAYVNQMVSDLNVKATDEHINRAYDIIVKIRKKYDFSWLNKCTILLPNKSVIHNTREISCNVNFGHALSDYENINEYPIIKYNNSGKIKFIYNYCAYMHTACYQYVKKITKININISHIPYFLLSTFSGIPLATGYYPMKIFYGQSYNIIFNIIKMPKLLTGNPLNNKELQKIIKKNLSALKLTATNIKKRKNRPSPFLSATLVKNGTYAIGNDGNIYKVQQGRWIKIKTKNSIIKIKGSSIKCSKKTCLSFNGMIQQPKKNQTPQFITKFKYTNGTFQLNISEPDI